MAASLSPALRRLGGVALANYALRLALAAGLALPFARLVEASGLEQFPAGDRLLFEPSGSYLLELLRLQGPELGALLHSSAWWLLPAAVVMLAARALSFVALDEERVQVGALCERAWRLVPGFLLIAGLVLLTQVLGAALLLWLGGRLAEALGHGSEPRGDMAMGGVIVLAFVAVALLGATGELARACLVHDSSKATLALARAFALLRRFPGRVLLAYGVPTAAGALIVGAAAVLSSWLDVGQPGSGRVWAVLLVHQLAVFALVALQILWLRRALGLSAAQDLSTSR